MGVRVHIENVILGRCHPGNFTQAAEYAETLGEADLLLVPWGLLGESDVMRANVAAAAELYLRLHYGSHFWIRHPAEQADAAAQIAERVSSAFTGSQRIAIHLQPESRCTLQAERLVVACGDGRVGFRRSLSALHGHLGLPHVLALPGGPLWLHDHADALDAIRRWMEAHDIREVVESRHESCGYRGYTGAELEVIAARDEPQVLPGVTSRVWRPLTGGFHALDGEAV